MSKYYVVQLKNGKKASRGGRFENGYMHATVSELGIFAVAIDTIAPRVVPLNRNAWKNGNIQFKITDAETGIKSYKVYIDGAFALFTFSSKNARLKLKHPNRLKKGIPHELTVEVTDYCGNQARESYTF